MWIKINSYFVPARCCKKFVFLLLKTLLSQATICHNLYNSYYLIELRLMHHDFNNILSWHKSEIMNKKKITKQKQKQKETKKKAYFINLSRFQFYVFFFFFFFALLFRE